jgi:hypothetical protein
LRLEASLRFDYRFFFGASGHRSVCRCNVRFVPKADICSAAKERLFDHLVGAGEH